MEPSSADDRARIRSLALHREVARRVRRDPRLINRAQTRVTGWIADGSVHPHYSSAWDELLRGPIEAILATLVHPSERAHDLRQVSPFAGVVDPQTRWRILSEAK